VSQPQALGRERGGHHPLVIDADDRGKGCVASTRDDRVGGVGRVGQVAKGLNLNRGSVSTRLTQLAKSGEIKKAARGSTAN
jgi:hypothetical protein